MKKLFFILIIIALLFTTGCVSEEPKIIEKDGYRKITADQAKKEMDKDDTIILIDVREKEEYDEEHIKGAVLIPYDDIYDRINEVAPDSNQKIFVYCRAGNRSKAAAQLLVALKYTNIYDIGGIEDWKWETVKK